MQSFPRGAKSPQMRMQYSSTSPSFDTLRVRYSDRIDHVRAQSLRHLQMFLDRRQKRRSELLQSVVIAAFRVGLEKFSRLLVALN